MNDDGHWSGGGHLFINQYKLEPNLLLTHTNTRIHWNTGSSKV